MGRKSKSDRINEVLRLNPALRRDDPRLGELFNAEDILRKAQLVAKKAAITATTANGGSKRSPEYVALDSATTAVRRLRNDLGIDRLALRRSEVAGVKIKRHPNSAHILAVWESDPTGVLAMLDLIPGYAAASMAHGLTEADVPGVSREAFLAKLEEQRELIPAIRERITQ